MASATLTTIQDQLFLYANEIFLFVGNIGNALIIIIFSQQRKTACSIYIISSAVVNFIFLILNGYYQAFPFDYSNETIGSVIFCKVFAYILSVFGQVGKIILIFACIDRFLITSDRASFRAFSTIKRAKYLVFFSFIFYLLLNLHVPIMIVLVNGRCIPTGIYQTIYTIVFLGLIPSTILVIFGYLTNRNMRKMLIRVQPVGQNATNANNSFQRRDRDLLIIVIAEVATYVVTTILFPVMLLETLISPSVIPNKSAQYTQIEIFILYIGYLLLFFNSAAPFYTYFISSKSFRRDVKQLFIKTYRKIRGQQPVENVSTTNRSLVQLESRV